MRVGFYGNNLNYGDNFVRKLRAEGIDASLWLPPATSGQDHPKWWASEEHRPWIHEVPGAVDPWSLVPLPLRPAVRTLYAEAAQLDVLVFMEEAPALFAGFDAIPKVLLSQGRDILDLPFLVPDRWLARTRRDLRALKVADAPSVTGVALARLARWSVMRSRQRRGIRECEAVVLLPFQEPFVERLRLDPAKVHYMQFVLDADVLHTADATFSHSLEERYGDLDVLFFHPTRHHTDHGDGLPKDNHKLVEAFAGFCKTSDARARLVMVEKGAAESIATSRRIIAANGITDRVDWVPEMTHVQLRSFYGLSNVVVCDQFNPDICSLGNIGRECGFFGIPLITSAKADLTVLYHSDIPPHIASADTISSIVAGMRHFSVLSTSERESLATATRSWSERNMSPRALMPKYIELLEATARTRVARS